MRERSRWPTPPRRLPSQPNGWADAPIRSSASTTPGRSNLAATSTTLAGGTATPRAYQFAWNDDIIAANQFSGVITSATEAIASGLDTEGAGEPIVVYNPLNIAREDVVEAAVNFPHGMPKAVRVIGPDGSAVAGTDRRWQEFSSSPRRRQLDTPSITLSRLQQLQLTQP